MEELAEEKAKYEHDIDSLTPATNSAAGEDRCRVSSAAKRPKKGTQNIELWTRLRKLSASQPDSLFKIMQSTDADSDGFLSLKEFMSVLGSLGITVAPKELEAAINSLFPGNSRSVFWLDLLVFLSNLGSDVAPAPSQLEQQGQLMPSIRELRIACMQLNLAPLDFQSHLAKVNSRQQAQAFFGGHLGLSNDWVVAWEELGTSGLLMRIPVSDIAMTESQRTAWWARCTSAVFDNRVELSDGFAIWDESRLMTEDQFQSICFDILGQVLSANDVAFLAAFAWEGNCISGQRVLSLAT